MPFICIVPVSPLRSEAAHRSEMVSQLLFGESCEVIEQKGEWQRIKSLYDDYEGWTQESHVAEVEELNNEARLNYQFTTDVLMNGNKMRVPLGCSLGLFSSEEIHIGKNNLSYKGKYWLPQKPQHELLVAIATEYLNVPYLWGGRSVFGIDCSGYAQAVFRFFGIKLLRDAYQQATQGEVVGFLQEARTGDLAFFDNAEGKIIHVGILLSDSMIIHSSGKVRIDKIDHQGIINVETGIRSHNLRVIKRYF